MSEILGPTDWVGGPGDDAAALPAGEGYLLVAGESIWPPYLEADPFGAGIAAVLANVNDVAAMGGRSLAIVDTVVGTESLARRILEGLKHGSDLFGVPVLGGHLTVRDGPPSLSAFVLGRAKALLPAANVRPGQALLVAGCIEGKMREDFPFFSSLAERRLELAADLEVLPRLAESGACAAAKDVSMAGLLGSLAMLLEPSGSGAIVDLERIPRPAGIPLSLWLIAFPSYGFVLAARPESADACRRAFAARGVACEVVGQTTATGQLRVRLRGDEAVAIEVASEGVTGMRRA